MVSIIICSKDKQLAQQSVSNFEATIGVPCEILLMDNSQSGTPITKVYNTAAANAKYPYLCFAHEDILFHTQNWGAKAIEVLNTAGVGMLGICGGVYKSQTPGGWIDLPRSYRRANMKWRDEEGNLTDYISRTSPTSPLSQTVTLDGLCLMMTKAVWEEFKFDEEHLRGFHYYDLDISLRIGAKYKLVISHQIFAEHLSHGNFGKSWIGETLKFHQRFYTRLPVHIGIDKKDEQQYLEDFSFKRFLEKCQKAGELNATMILRLLWSYPRFTIKNFIFLARLKG